MLKTGKFWFKWVGDVWEEYCSHTVNLNEHTFIIWDARNKSHTWKVYYFDDTPPEYECGKSIS